YQLTKSTVLRAGYGIFYYTNSQIYFGNLPVTNPPFYQTTDVPTSSDAATSNLIVRTGFPPGTLRPDVLTGLTLFNAWPYDFPDPLVHQWNFNVQRALPGSTVLSLAYVGSNTIHRRAGVGNNSQDLNQPKPGPGALPARRTFPELSAINTDPPLGGSNYQGLEVKFERQFKNGLATLNGYTWSHSMMTGVGQNTRELEREKSLSSEDVRHRLFSTVIWDLPFGKGKKWVSAGPASRIIGGWQLSTLLTAQSGLLFTPTMGANSANTTGANRPDRIGAGSLSKDQRTWQMWFDKTAFRVPSPYVFGNAGAYLLAGPGLVNLDTTIARVFPLSDRVRLDFRSEFFNMLNHVNFGMPNALIDNRVGGAISSAAVAARQIQFAVKLVF
ncbi:MAG: hypothetical protein NT024_00395, partial [Proteobacteria bacterium]|nr:hypothetical protein [Pseudomonadota bacterium]